MASLTGAIANGGVVYAPRLVRSIIDPISKEETPIESNVVARDVVDTVWMDIVGDGMRDCVQYGACRRLSLLPFSSAGKTGTAQWHGQKENHAWFTSFAPYENPEISVSILVEEGGGGAEVAVPIAYEFYQWWGQQR
jgi:cell division protein FtsI/penicillin-binding protein 2